MRHLPLFAAITLLTVSAAHAQTRTFVNFAGKNDELPKLGLPGITVEVFGPRVDESTAVRTEIGKVMTETIHTRPVAAGETGDYALAVTLAAPITGAGPTTVPFEAVLKTRDGQTLWRIDGRTEVEQAGVEPQALVAIARNVVSALIHDGWVQPRYNPDDPPPAPPTIRRSGS